MRVLLVNPAAQLGGGERSLLDLVGAVGKGAKFSLLVTEDGPLVARARALGVEVQVLPLPEPLSRLGDGKLDLSTLGAGVAGGVALPRYLQRLREAALLTRPDVVHSNGMKAHILTALALPQRLPLIWHVRDYLSSRRLSRLLLRRLAGRVTLVLANSDSVAKDAAATLGEGVSVRRIYNGIDTAHFAPAGDELELAGHPAVRIGLVATYARWKGHELFLEAAARYRQLRPSPPKARFFVIGGQVYSTEASQISRAELEAKARALELQDQVEFLPFQDDPAKVYRALDIVVNASTAPEPFGRTIVEALACGRPVVAARHGGASELLVGPLAALGVAPCDHDDLARRLAMLAGDPTARAALGRAGREVVLARFSWSQLRDEALAAYLLACDTR